MTEKKLAYDDLLITPADVFEQMGYRDALPDDVTQQETQAVMEEVQQWLRPQFCYFVVQELPSFEMGKIILRQLRGSEAYALFICTAGTEFENYQQRLMAAGDMVRVFIADALGSVIAEKTADRMEEQAPHQPFLSGLLWLACFTAAIVVSNVPRPHCRCCADGFLLDGAHQER